MAQTSATPLVSILKMTENDLLNLSAEARRTLPAVKEAAERAIFDLRGLQNGSTSSSTVPTTTGSTSSGQGRTSTSTTVQSSSPVLSFDSLSPEKVTEIKVQWLHPFLFACNHVDAPKKVLAVAISAIQRLITCDGVAKNDVPSIARILEIQAESTEEDLRLKVLQTLPLLLNQPSYTPDARLLAQVMALGFNFFRDKSVIIKRTATATIQQAFALMFERADQESTLNSDNNGSTDVLSSVPSNDTNNNNNTILSGCRFFLQDMVLVTGGLPTQWMKKGTPVPRVLAADLLEDAVRNHPRIFRTVSEFRELAATLLIPLLLRQLPTQLSFPLLLRYFRIARMIIIHLHTSIPIPCRALLSLFVRMIHASAKGEDLGADATTKLGRFGSAGARILKGGHRALGATPGSILAEMNEGGNSTPSTPNPSSSSATSSVNNSNTPSSQSINMTSDESSLMAAVAVIPLGPMPLFKCILLLETILSFVSRPNVLTSLFIQYDLQDSTGQETITTKTNNTTVLQTPIRTPVQRNTSQESTTTSSGRVVEHIIDALCALVYRLLVLQAPQDDWIGSFSSNGGGSNSRDSFSSPSMTGVGMSGNGNNNPNNSNTGPNSASINRRRSRRMRDNNMGIDASFEDIALTQVANNSNNNGTGNRNSISGTSNGSSITTDDGFMETEEGGDEFAVYLGDVDIAIETFYRRPLANLVCPDADNHVFGSSAGGIQAAIAHAPPSTTPAGVTINNNNSSGGSPGLGIVSSIASLTVGAAFSFVSAAASTGSSFINNAASKISGSASNTTGNGETDNGGNNAMASAYNVDTIAPPSGIHAATLIVMAIESIYTYIGIVTSSVCSLIMQNDGIRAPPAFLAIPRLPSVGINNSYSVSTTGGNNNSVPNSVAGTNSSSMVPATQFRSPGRNNRPTTAVDKIGAQISSTLANTNDYLLMVPIGNEMIELSKFMIVCSYRSIMQSLSVLIEMIDTYNVCTTLFQAYNGLCFSSGALGLEGPRDSLLVNLCRLSLPVWDPSPGVASIAYSLLGTDSRGSTGSSSSSSSSMNVANNSSAQTNFRRGVGPPDIKHALGIRTLLSLAHGLGGVLHTSWVVIIDTLEQYGAHVAVAEGISSTFTLGSIGIGGITTSSTSLSLNNGNGLNPSGNRPSSTPSRTNNDNGANTISLLDMLRDQQATVEDLQSGGTGTVEGSQLVPYSAPRVHLLGTTDAPVLLGISIAEYTIDPYSSTIPRLPPTSVPSISSSFEGTNNTVLSNNGNDSTSTTQRQIILVGEDDNDLILDSDNPNTTNDLTGSNINNSILPLSSQSILHDTGYAFLHTALARLFASTVHLRDSILSELIQALSELTITAFAESATAELTAISMMDNRNPTNTVPASAIKGNATVPMTPVQPTNGKEMIKNSTSPTNGNSSTVVLSGSVNTGVSARLGATDAGIPPGTVTPSATATLGGMPTATGAQPPFALQRLMQTCAFNVWRIGAVWNPLSALLRVLARSPSASIRRFGVTCLADLTIANLLKLSAPPVTIPLVNKKAYTESGKSVSPPSSPGKLGTEGFSVGTKNNLAIGENGTALSTPFVSQEALLSPFADYWRSPYATSRTECLRSIYRIIEEAGSSLGTNITSSLHSTKLNSLVSPHGPRKGGPLNTPGRTGPIRGNSHNGGAVSTPSGTVPNEPPSIIEGDGWSVAIGILFCVGSMAVEVDPTGISLVSNSPDEDTDGTKTDGQVDTSVTDTASAAYGAAEGLYSSSLPTCIFEAPDRHGQTLQPYKQVFLADAFRIIQLIADDFLDILPYSDLSLLILVLGFCVRQNFDVNLRLTTVGLLWKLSDRLAQIRAVGSIHVAIYESLWRQVFLLLLSVGSGSDIFVLPTLAETSRPSIIITNAQHQQIRLLTFPTPAARQQASHRPDEAEVRNSAVQALFSCLIAHGSVMGDDLWAAMFNGHVLSLIYEITTVAQVYSADDSAVEGDTVGKRRGAAEGSSGTVRLMLHHSRDTLSKQWNETRTIAYQGLVRTMGACFNRLATFPWFFDAWTDVLAVLERSVAGRHRGSNSGSSRQSMFTPKKDTGETGTVSSPPGTPIDETTGNQQGIFLEPASVSVAGINCLQELALLVCVPAGPGRPLDDDDRVGFDMRVVDGALVRVSQTPTNTNARSRSGSGIVTPSSSSSSSSSSTASTGSSSLASSTTINGVDPSLRDRMYQDVRSVLNGIVGCAAVTIEEEETVAVAVIDTLTAIATSATDTSTGSGSTGRARSLPEDNKRFNDAIGMMWAVLDSRRRYRWAHANASSVTKGEKIAAEEVAGPKLDIPTNAERAVLRSLEKITTILRSLTTRIVMYSQSLSLSVSGAHNPSLPISKELEPLISAWITVLEILRKCASLDEALYAVDFVKGAELPAIALMGLSKAARVALLAASNQNNANGDGSIEVALPPPALASLALKLFHKILQPESTTVSSSNSSATNNGNTPTGSNSAARRSSTGGKGSPSVNPENTSTLEDAIQLCIDTAFQRTFPATVTVLAQTLLHARDLADRASAEIDAGETEKTTNTMNKSAVKPPPVPSATNASSSIFTTGTTASGTVRRAGNGLLLEQSCAAMGLSSLVNSNASSLSVSDSSRGTGSSSALSSNIRDTIYPIKIWGFGLGGSYGNAGDGSLIVSDAAKTKRNLTRAKAYCDALMTALVAVIRQRLTLASAISLTGSSVNDANASSESTEITRVSSVAGGVDIWLSLLSTLEVLVGFNPVTSGTGSGSSGIPNNSSNNTSSSGNNSIGGLGSPVVKRGPTDSYTAITRFFENILLNIDNDAQVLAKQGSSTGTTNTATKSKLDAAAALRFDNCQAGADTGMWNAVNQLYKAVISSSTTGNPNLPSTPVKTVTTNNASNIANQPPAFDSLRGFIGPGSAVTPTLVEPILRSRTYGAALRYLGWYTLRNTGASGTSTTGSTDGINSAKNTNDDGSNDSIASSLEAEVFLLSALLDGYASLLHSDQTVTTHGFVAFTKRLISLLVAGISTLGHNGTLFDLSKDIIEGSSGSNNSAIVVNVTTHDSVPSAALAEAERKRRTFGRICFGALLQLCTISIHGMNTSVDIRTALRSREFSSSRSRSGTSTSETNTVSMTNSTATEGSVTVATSIANEIRQFSRQIVLHAVCRLLNLHYQIDIGLAQARSAARVAATTVTTSSSFAAGPCGSLVVDASYALTILRYLVEPDPEETNPNSKGTDSNSGNENSILSRKFLRSSGVSNDSIHTFTGGSLSRTLMLPYRTLVNISTASEPFIRYQVQKLLFITGDQLFMVLQQFEQQNQEATE